MTAKKVMVVEDEAVVAMAIREIIGLWGFEACGAASSKEEALRVAEKDRPDLVLMDVSLAGREDGIEAARQIKALFSIPVVFMTGHMDMETKKRAESLGPIGFLAKPVNFDEMARLLRSALGG